ncbi:MAG: hypothetical protein HQL31_00925 [Planctomycetes bacterium]|nr:hypothetical protein [Planctomycetota bacterium]
MKRLRPYLPPLLLALVFIEALFLYLRWPQNQREVVGAKDRLADAEHLSLRPDKSLGYAFTNLSLGSSSPAWNKDVPVEERKNKLENHIWESTCKGVISLEWKGYEVSAKLGAELANFSYSLRGLEFQEASQSGEQKWKEQYGGNVIARVEVGGKGTELKRSTGFIQSIGNFWKLMTGSAAPSPLGEQLGDPCKDFLLLDNRASFFPDGRAAVYPQDLFGCSEHGALPLLQPSGSAVPVCPVCGKALSAEASKGQLLSPANYYHNYQNQDAKIGQYYLKGIPVEELVHRIGIMTPPATKDGEPPVSWSTDFPFWLKVNGLDPAQPQMRWQWVSKTTHAARAAWLIRFQVSLKAKNAPSPSGELDIQNLSFSRHGEAYLDTESRMPLLVKVKDSLLWTDAFSYALKDKQPRHQIMQHHFENIFTAEGIP